MSQTTSGLRSILSQPIIYSVFQWLMGAKAGRQNFVKKYIRPESGMRILDLGCGPADILEYIPNVEYWGFDISETYIDRATKRFAERGHFECKVLTISDIEKLPKFDIVLGIGLLHHLDEETALNILNLSLGALKKGGRLLTIDPCFDKSQGIVSKLLISYDRGQNVRTLEGYSNLVSSVFKNIQATLRHQKWIPYTHCIMECFKE